MPTFEKPISVFDLPNLRHEPTYEEILQALQCLEIKPSLWDQLATKSKDGSQEAVISRYLMAIISSMLEWFDGDDDKSMEKKETLWNLASKRVAERCGRSAMGEMTRNWIIPASDMLPELILEIREPPLTGDNLGLKTWGTAYAISKKLEYFGVQYFNELLKPQWDVLNTNARVLELGAGTGLVGIAAFKIWSKPVVLTDLPEIQANLNFNIQKNRDSVVEPRGGQISAAVLDWRNSDDGLAGHTKEFDIIIAADSLYDDEHPHLVAAVTKKYLKKDSKSRALIAVPMRDEKTRHMAEVLKDSLKREGFRLFHQGWEICRDDWEDSSEEEEVKCWWGVFGLGVGVLAIADPSESRIQRLLKEE